MLKTVFAAALLLCAGGAFAQNFDSLLTLQRTADPQEKVYVHFDKAYYNPGETIWFKAYLFSGGEPSIASKNFYAELVDESGNVISQKTAPVYFAGATGSFDVDSAFKKSLVYFRGYTVSVLNGDSSFLYTKAIRILVPKATTAKPAASVSNIRFLPEGGDWVTGLPGNVAFAVTNEQGLPVAASGTVADNTGAKMAEFKTLHNGMGRFSLTPEEGKTYTATWKDETGKTYTTQLPTPKTEGIRLTVTEAEGGNKRFVLYRTQTAPENLKQLRLLGHMNQQLVMEARINLEGKFSAGGVLPVQELSTGILQLTILDAANKPVAERITFVNKHDYELDGDVFIGLKNLAARGLNQMEVTMSDTLPANLSLSVTDADLNTANPMEENIVSRFLLTGDLRGKIVNPYYYFFSNADSAAIHLDLVMLTHGWRRYNWDDVLAGRTPQPKLNESNYLSLSGQVTGLMPNSFTPDLQLTGILQTADSAKNLMVLPVDKKGNVFADGLVFYDNAKLFFSFNKKSLSFDKSMLLLNNGLRRGLTKAWPDTAARRLVTEPPAAVASANATAARKALRASQQLAQAKMMETVTVRTRAKTTKEKMEEKYVSGLFSGDGVSFDLVNDPLTGGYLDIFQYLQGRVAGLQITTGGGQPSLSWRGGTPALYLNEMQTDASMIQSTPVTDIAYVKILRPGSSIVSGGGGGVIAIYTRKGGDAQPDPNAKGLSFVQVSGYSPVKQFYSPDYATFSERDAYDDVRTTLYWNPSIYLDKNRRRLRLKFYNSDVTKRFKLVLEGFNVAGKLIHVEKEIGGTGAF